MTRRISMLCALAFAASAPAAHAAPTFSAAASLLATERTARVIVVADLNADGRQDIAIGEGGNLNGQLRVFLARTGGGYEQRGPYPVQSDPVSLRAVDVDGDGRLDLSVGLYGSAAQLLTALPDGGYGPAQVIGAIGDLGIGDFNGDGRQDLAYATYLFGPRGIRVGTALAGGGYDWKDHPTADLTHDVYVTDIDGDGLDDVFAGHSDYKEATLFRGSRSGLVAPVPHYRLGIYAEAHPVAADLDGDGRPDFVWADRDRLLISRGHGPDVRFTEPLGTTVGGRIEAVRVADIDGDGLQDILALSDAGLYVVPIKPGGAPGTPVRHELGTDAGFHGLGVGDLDGDERPDVVTPEKGGVRIRSNRTPALALSTPALSRDGAIPVTRSVTAFFPAMYFIRLYGKSPGDAEFRQVGQAYPAGEGTHTIRAWAGDGEYRLRIEAFGWNHGLLETLAPIESLTRVDTSIAPPPEPPAVTATPTPTATATPDPVVAETPRERPSAVATPEPAAARLRFDVRSRGKTSTRLVRLRIEDVRPGMTISVRCAQCPAKTYTKRNARGTVTLARFVARPLKVGTTIRITFAEPGAQPVLATITMRSRRDPKVTTKLVPL